MKKTYKVLKEEIKDIENAIEKLDQVAMLTTGPDTRDLGVSVCFLFEAEKEADRLRELLKEVEDELLQLEHELEEADHGLQEKKKELWEAKKERENAVLQMQNIKWKHRNDPEAAESLLKMYDGILADVANNVIDLEQEMAEIEAYINKLKGKE